MCLLLGAVDVGGDGADDCNYHFRLKSLYYPGKSDFTLQTNSLAILFVETVHRRSTQVNQVTPKSLK